MLANRPGVSARAIAFAALLGAATVANAAESEPAASPEPAAAPKDASDCPAFGPPRRVGTAAAAELVEASGLVASRAHAGVLWTHNDSGDTARLFALAEDGTLLGTLVVRVPTPRDVEDLAIAPAPGGGWTLWMGDIGDNGRERDAVRLYAVREPADLPRERPFRLEVEATTWTVRYPDVPRNAETLLADPATGDLYIVEKTESPRSRIERIAAPRSKDGKGGALATVRVASIPLAVGLATGGTVSPDGLEIVVRGYGPIALLFRRAKGAPFASAFAAPPCEVTIPFDGVGEAIAFSADGRAIYTTNEGASQPIHRVDQR